ncbi:MAG: preprotein translocase subunit YajC [Polynucleobacter sp.]|jgi:preprotein translocase subunit YajC|uniref:preprotein translocase subunit YajC n=1 Tax=Polynucleobacter TaxID=44013 RepID=UPI000D3B78F9|nr:MULTISPECIES: preprotein translocase subunit YajC [Polynucleobacter]MBU3726895.1 preprotein translocase subunit YajC [Polynucleobacter sp.]MBU6322087.1 preprotein translocase subunit YajC [Burkholderiales bacterium]NBO85706.1 preprotein translocase subunit YajC [Burkholderiaceae bacterium]NBO86713.1 preprotein translocase subunit YajC [Burkholderiaceae bacterium]NBP18578.1 preprotein translocase subunit YajC [Burkholderiaceae bacterium]
MLISNAFAQSAPAAGGDAGGLMSFIPLILMFVVLYFIMIRPQMKRQKETKAMLEALAAGDEVITAGGILGKVTAVKDQYVTLELVPGTEVQMQKNAVTSVLPKGTIKSV